MLLIARDFDTETNTGPSSIGKEQGGNGDVILQPRFMKTVTWLSGNVFVWMIFSLKECLCLLVQREYDGGVCVTVSIGDDCQGTQPMGGASDSQLRAIFQVNQSYWTTVDFISNRVLGYTGGLLELHRAALHGFSLSGRRAWR